MIDNCPKCDSNYTYEDGGLMVCPMCNYQWHPETIETYICKDAYGNVIEDGDCVSLVKDLKVKGSSSGLKRGFKIRAVHVVEKPDHIHNLTCKVEGIGSLEISSKYVKKI